MPDTQLVEVLRRCFAGAPSAVVCAYLFGSQARGSAAASSDIDIGVLLQHDAARADPLGLRLGGDLERSLGRAVDVIVLNSAAPDLVHRVLRDGLIVIDRDPAARARFEVAARNAYFDLKPHLDRYRRVIHGGHRG
jgi:predicted nucleotidyltransferase